MARMSSIEQDSCATRKDLECDPVWHLLAVSCVRPCATERKEVEVLGGHLSAGLE